QRCGVLNGSIQQFLCVELGVRGYPINSGYELVNLLLDLGAVVIGVSVIGSLNGELPHPLQDCMRLLECPLSCLDQRDTILGVPNGLPQTPDLATHLLRDS